MPVGTGSNPVETDKGKCRCCGATSPCVCYDDGCFPWEDVDCGCLQCSCQCVCSCHNRSGGYYSEYEIIVSGLVGDPFIESPPFSGLVSICGPNCSILNGTFILKHRSSCQWTTDETLTAGMGGGCFAAPPGGGTPTLPLWTMTMPYCGRGCLTHPRHYDPDISTSRHNTWGFSSGASPVEPDTATEGLCRTSQNLPAGAVENCISSAGFIHFCNVRPDPITVTPVAGTWVSCGLPDPSIMSAEASRSISHRLIIQEPKGPGTELRKLLRSIGLSPKTGVCLCDDMASNMNLWGVDGCKLRLGEIVIHLKEQFKQTPKSKILKAAALSVLNRWAYRIDILDPIPSIVLEAIRRVDPS